MESKYDTGMSYWAKSLEMKLSIGDSVGAATTMNNMAMYYRDIGQTEKALDFYSQVLRIKQNIQDHASISMAYLNLGELFYQKEDYEKSLDYYRKALKEADKKRNEEARENYIKDLRDDPYLNILTENYFELHKDRLRLHRVSTYQGITYHLGPKGGLYYRSSKGTRIYI